MIRRLGTVLALSLLAKASNVAIEFKLPGIDSWQPYGSATFDVGSEVYVSQEMSKGKVVGAVKGDAIDLAEKAWDKYTPNQIGSNRIEFKIEDVDTNSISFSSLDLTDVRSERSLAKVLTHSDFVFHVDSEKNVVGASVRVAWDQIQDLSSSHSRAGSVIVSKPLAPSRVIEDPPKPVEVSSEEDLVDALQPRKGVQREASFFRKYWWMILGGLMFFNAMNRQPAEEPPARAAPTAAENSANQQQGRPEKKR